MKWVTASWAVVRDILLTGTGVFLIFREAFAPRPSGTLLVVAMALTTPALAEHARTLLGGPGGSGGQESSPSPPGRGSAPGSSSSREE